MSHTVILVGTPRRGGNSELLARAFQQQAQVKGHTTELILVREGDYGPCHACDACWSKGKPCVFEDSFDDIAPKLEAADTIVFCTPLWWYSFNGALKNLIDKFYAYCRPVSPLPKLGKKRAMLIATAAGDEFRGLQGTYEEMLGFLEWEDLGRLLVKEAEMPGDVLKSDAFDHIAPLVAEL